MWTVLKSHENMIVFMKRLYNDSYTLLLMCYILRERLKLIMEPLFTYNRQYTTMTSLCSVNCFNYGYYKKKTLLHKIKHRIMFLMQFTMFWYRYCHFKLIIEAATNWQYQLE